MSSSREPIANVVGANLRRIRETIGLTQGEAAQYVRRLGPLWSASRVGDFERGRSDVALGLLVTLSLAMTSALRDAQARGSDVAVGTLPADFLRTNKAVELTSMGPDPLGPVVAAVLSGEPWPATDAELLGVDGAAMRELFERITTPRKIDPAELAAVELLDPLDDIRYKAGLAERRVAQRLGVDLDTLAGLSFDLWGQTFTEARNEIAGVDASKQKRGRVARELEQKLRERLGRGES